MGSSLLSSAGLKPNHDVYNAELQPVLLLSILVVSVLGCAVRHQSYWSKALVVAVVAGLTAVFVGWTKGPAIDGDYGAATFLMANCFVLSDYLLVTRDLHKDLKRKGEGRDGHTSRTVEDAPFHERLKWSWALLSSVRGIGWEHETKHQSLIRAQRNALPNPRLAFFKSRSLALAGYILAYAIGDFFVYLNPSFRVDGPPFASQPWWFRPTVLGYALLPYGTMCSLHTVVSIVAVCVLRVGKPGEWQSMFGTWRDLGSLSEFWGRGWHQMLRRLISSHYAFVNEKIFSPLRLSKTARTALKVTLAFLMSGIMHLLASYAALRRWHASSWVFFVIQPFAIFLEFFVAKFFNRGEKARGFGLGRMIGYVWTLGWLTLTLPIFLEPLVRIGLLEGSPHFPVCGVLAERARLVLGL